MESHEVLVRRELVDLGISPSAIACEVRAGRWVRVHNGIFVRHSDDPTVVWLRRLAAHLVWAGPEAVVSHRAAARLWGFDGFESARDEDIAVPNTCRLPGSYMHRTRRVIDDSATRRGIRVTTAARTIADLAALCSADQLEKALESALRGDPRRPRDWKPEVLAAIRDLATGPQRGTPGVTNLRLVLARRECELPTGSGAETAAWQLLRAAGLTAKLTRQPEIQLLDPDGRVVARNYPDLAALEYGVLFEIDGRGAHSTDDRACRNAPVVLAEFPHL